VLLGEVVTTLALTPGTPIGERCGSCTLCLEACPTSAFDAPFVLDPRRCISYLTIEHRKETPEALRPLVGEHLFGCDVCQDVCPFNHAATTQASRPLRGSVRAQYAPLPFWSEASLEALVDLTDEDFHARLEGSPVRRATPAGLVRNAVTVLANRRDPRYRALFERVARGHRDAAVREHARWALRLLEKGEGDEVGSQGDR